MKTKTKLIKYKENIRKIVFEKKNERIIKLMEM